MLIQMSILIVIWLQVLLPVSILLPMLILKSTAIANASTNTKENGDHTAISTLSIIFEPFSARTGVSN